MSKPLPTIELLRELFRLDPEAGKIFWRVRTGNRIHVGDEVGGPASGGYRRVNLSGHLYTVHRVIFALANGRWPIDQVDHINGIRADNRPCNLRDATSSQNKHNCGKRKTNKSGFKGVSWDKARGKWHPQIQAYGKYIYLGRYDDVELAALVYAEAARKYHGEFARA